MHHTVLAPVDDDTEEAPWMVMGTPQSDAINLFYQTLDVYARSRIPPLFAAQMLPIRYRPIPSARIEQLAPDVMVAAVPRHDRQSYDLEREGAAPLFVLEIVSPASQHRDRAIKPQRYELMGVLEYALFDPGEEGGREPGLEGYRREQASDGFIDWQTDDVGRLYSNQMELWLTIREGELRLQRPDGRWLPTNAESEAARAESDAARLAMEAALHLSEAALKKSEAEVERLRAELERYRQQ